MPDHPFAGTAAIVRRALDRHFPDTEPGDAVWQGVVGLDRVPVRADVVGLEGTKHPLVRLQAMALERALDGTLARAMAAEQEGLPLGRLEHDGSSALVAASLLGGGTLDVEECITAAYAVAKASAQSVAANRWVMTAEMSSPERSIALIAYQVSNISRP